ncbi:hypothetical protein EDC01DRAFT_609168 [Geopyxis carbonaria]|nr:hypothetical protein EDC01DRAFT_609168 [Geopyxis carbonaria]
MDPNTMRKIELSSPEDMRHLIALITAKSTESLTTHLPSASPTDPLRTAVAAHIDRYIAELFTLAAPSITVNGLPALPPHAYSAERETIEEFEPYDRALHSQVTDMHAAIEKATVEVATLRREVPQQVVKKLAKERAIEDERDERFIKGLAEKEVPQRGDLLAGVNVERAQEVLEARDRAVKGLEELGLRLPAVAHKLTRAGEAVDYILQKREKERSASSSGSATAEGEGQTEQMEGVGS